MADAMITSRRGLALGIVTADCAPVLFSDAAGTCVGAAHAGWRGAVAGVLEATGMAMRSKGATGIRAVIGPCIQQQSYEVGPDLRDAVLERNATFETFFVAGKAADKWQFDLPAYCAARLAKIDLPATILRRDTYAEEQDFFSHRRRILRKEPAIGHQISAIRVSLMRKSILMAALLLTSCGTLPQPFYGDPGVEGAKLATPPPPVLMIPPPGQALLGDDAAKVFASDLATALVSLRRPQHCRPGR